MFRLSRILLGAPVVLSQLMLLLALAGQSAGQVPVDAPMPGVSAEIGNAYQLKPIATLGADIRPREGKLPTDHTAGTFGAEPVAAEPPTWSEGSWKTFSWEAPATCHRPLYYENVNLERHGYSFGVAQPFVSAGHFACSTVILPYRMAAEPYRQPVYTLGHVRPGTPTPFQIHWPRPSAAGGLAEAALIVGLICLIP